MGGNVEHSEKQAEEATGTAVMLQTGSDSRIPSSSERRAAYASKKSRSLPSDSRRAAYGASKSKSLPVLEEKEESWYAEQVQSGTVLSLGGMKFYRHVPSSPARPGTVQTLRSKVQAFRGCREEHLPDTMGSAALKSSSTQQRWTSHEKRAAFGRGKSNSLPMLDSFPQQESLNRVSSKKEPKLKQKVVSNTPCSKACVDEGNSKWVLHMDDWVKAPLSSGTSDPDSCVQRPKYKRSQSCT